MDERAHPERGQDEHAQDEDRNTAQAVARFMSDRDQFARHLGIELLELRPGYSRVRVSLEPYMVNGLGLAHGAVIFAVADFAFAAACNSYGTVAVALSMDVHFISSPGPGALLFGEAKEIRRGRRTGLYHLAVRDEQGNLIADLHGMAYRKDTRFLENENDL
jgi:acyl-CoA thioesterase